MALDYGFSSLQEVIRVFMRPKQLRSLNRSFQDEDRLSPEFSKEL